MGKVAAALKLIRVKKNTKGHYDTLRNFVSIYRDELVEYDDRITKFSQPVTVLIGTADGLPQTGKDAWKKKIEKLKEARTKAKTQKPLAEANGKLKAKAWKDLSNATEKFEKLKAKDLPGKVYSGVLKTLVGEAGTLYEQNRWSEVSVKLGGVDGLYTTQANRAAEDLKNQPKEDQKLIPVAKKNLADAEEKYHDLRTEDRPTKAYSAPLKAAVETARKAVAEGRWQDAIDAVATVENLYETQSKLAEEDRGAELEEKRHEPVYGDKKRRIEEALERIEGMPGTEKQRVKLRGLLTAGEVQANKGEYKKAYKALEGLSGAVKAAEEAAEKFRKTANGNPEIKRLLDDARAEVAKFDELAGVANGALVEKAYADLDLAMKKLETPGTADAVKNEVTVLFNKFKGDLVTYQLAKDEAALLETQLKEKINGQLQKMVAPATAGLYRDRLNAAVALLSGQLYAESKRAFEALATDAQLVIDGAQAAYSEWSTFGSKITGWETEVFKTPGTEQIFVPGPEAMQVKTALALADAAARAADFPGAVLKAQEAEAAVVEFRKVYANCKLHKVNFGKKQTEFEQAKLASEKDIARLRAANADPAGFEQLLAAAKKAWDDASALALRGGGDFDTHLTMFKTATFDIKKQIDDLLTKPEKSVELTVLKTQTMDKQKIAEAAEKLAAVNESIDDLGLEDEAAAKTLAGDLDKLRKEIGANAPTTVQNQKIAELAQKVADEAERVAAAGTLAANGFRNGLRAVKDKYDNLKKKHKNYTGYLKAIEYRFDGLGAMVGETSATLQKKAKERLDATGLEIDGADAKLLALTARLAECDSKLEMKDVVDFRKGRRAGFKQRMAQEVRPGVYAAMPDAAAKLLEPVEHEIDDLVRQAGEAARRQAVNVRDADMLLQRVEAELADVPKLKAALKARLKKVQDPPEGDEATVVLDLAIVTRTLNDIRDSENPGDAAAGREREQIEKTRHSEEEAEAYKAAKDLFEKNALREAQAAFDETPKKDRDAGRLADLKATVKQADKHAKNKAYALALEKLRQATDEARALALNPMGGRSTARNELPKVNAKWKSSVSDFLRSLAAIKAGVKEQLAGDPELAKSEGPVLASIDYASALFDMAAFDAAVDAIIADGATLQQRRVAKEKGLKVIREYRVILGEGKHPLLDHLRIAEAPVPKLDTDPLEDRLADLELNLLRA